MFLLFNDNNIKMVRKMKKENPVGKRWKGTIRESKTGTVLYEVEFGPSTN